MQRSVEERLALVEQQCDAYMLIILALMEQSWPRVEHRTERRETICDSIEKAFGRIRPDEHSHVSLQRVLGEVERMFDLADEMP